MKKTYKLKKDFGENRKDDLLVDRGRGYVNESYSIRKSGSFLSERELADMCFPASLVENCSEMFVEVKEYITEA